MNRNRQKKIIKQSSCTSLLNYNYKHLNDYGLKQHPKPQNESSNSKPQNKSTNPKPQNKLIKSKSHNDILIPKDKKLIQFFPQIKKNPFFNHLSINLHLKTKNHPKLTLISNKQTQNSQQTKKSQQTNTFRTSYFGEIPQTNQNKFVQFKKNDTALLETLQTDRNQAKKIKQKLKKSTSMKNLIEQRYLSQTQEQKLKNLNARKNIYTQKIGSDYEPQTYDSKKYNWRLSHSNDKIKQKSLSSFQSKVKILPVLQIKQTTKSRISLNLNKNTISNGKMHNGNQYQPSENKNSHKDNLAFTFGSNFYKNVYFH